MPEGRSDRKYCSGQCRRDAFAERAHHGEVAGVRKLKNGKLSVTVHLEHDPGIEPGQRVRIDQA